MNKANTCTCPACGNTVRLPRGAFGPSGRVEPEDLDRLAHAACGCYVLTMPAGQVKRLLASVLAAGSNEDRLDEEPFASDRHLTFSPDRRTLSTDRPCS